MSFPLSHKPHYFIPIKSEENITISTGINSVAVTKQGPKPSWGEKGLVLLYRVQPIIHPGKPSQKFKPGA